MEITESQLAGALERFYVTVESGGGDGRGNLLTARGPVADADATAEALFATLSRMAALREPERRPKPEPRGGVTREQLAKAVDGMEIVVDLTGRDVVPGTWTGAKLRYPGPFATAVFARLADEAPEDAELADELARSPVAADPELSFLGMTMAALGEMSDFAAARCMAYLSNRYPPED